RNCCRYERRRPTLRPTRAGIRPAGLLRAWGVVGSSQEADPHGPAGPALRPNGNYRAATPRQALHPCRLRAPLHSTDKPPTTLRRYCPVASAAAARAAAVLSLSASQQGYARAAPTSRFRIARVLPETFHPTDSPVL